MYYYDDTTRGCTVVEITRGDSKSGTWENRPVLAAGPGGVVLGKRRSGTYG